MSENIQVTYKFATGEVNSIDLAELVSLGVITQQQAIEIGEVLTNLEDESEKSERKETRRHISLDKLRERFFPLESIMLHKPDTMEDELARVDMLERIHLAMKTVLTETQCRRFIAYHIQGLTYQQIAKCENAHFTSVSESILTTDKKLKNFFKKY